jgi:hypothetical protein
LLELNAKTRETGFEYGNTIVGGERGEPFTSNLSNRVEIPKDRIILGKRTEIYHSHTNATPPSGEDFYQLLRNGVDKIGVIGQNGDVFTVSIGKGIVPSVDEYKAFLDTIRIETYKTVSDMKGFENWTLLERHYMRVREQFFRIIREYKWKMEGGNIYG